MGEAVDGVEPIPVERERVLRGGAYDHRISGIRASDRVHHPASSRIAVAGLRCAQDLEPRPAAPLPPDLA